MLHIEHVACIVLIVARNINSNKNMKNTYTIKSKLGFYSISSGWHKEYPEAEIFNTRKSAILTAGRLAQTLQCDITLVEDLGYGDCKETRFNPVDFLKQGGIVK